MRIGKAKPQTVPTLHYDNPEGKILLKQDLFVFKAASIITLVALLLLLLLHGGMANNVDLAIIEILAVVAVACNILLFKHSKNISLAKFLYLSIILWLVLSHVLTGGYASTGLYWVFIFPIVSVFIYRERQGIYWISLLYLALAAIVILAATEKIYIPFTVQQVFEMLLVLSAVTAAVVIYRKSVMMLEDRVISSSYALENEKTKLNAILLQMQDGVVVTDRYGRIELINPSAEVILVYRHHELQGKLWLEAITAVNESHEPLPADQRPEPWLIRGRKKPNHIQVNFMRKDGTIVTVDALGSTLKVNGEVEGYIASMRDVTSLHKADQAKSDFVNLASHQLRTPLSSIRWHSELLLDLAADRLSPDEKSSLESIDDSANKMSLLVNDLLSMARIESGSIMANNQEINIHTLIKNATSDFDAELHERKISIDLQLPKDLPIIKASESALHQCIASLLDNAIKYSPDNSTITIAVSAGRSSVVITVQDHGIGIPPEHRQQIFQKFYRADNASKYRTDGTGLGLYLVKSLAELLKGSVNFDSEVNKGTAFHIRIPLESKE